MIRNLINAPLAMSAASIGAVALYLLVQSPGLVESVFVGGSGEDTLASARELSLRTHEANTAADIKTVINRSPFYTPLPTPPPLPPHKEIETPVYVPPPPPPPTTYTGPSLVAAFGNSGIFKRPSSEDPPFVLNTGETDHGVTLVSADPPWSVRVKYKGKEFDVPVFKSADFLSTLSNSFAKRGASRLPIQDVEGKPKAEGASETSASEGEEEGEQVNGDEGAESPTTAADEGEDAAPADEGDGGESNSVRTSAAAPHRERHHRSPRGS